MRSADKKKMQELIREECANYCGGYCPIKEKSSEPVQCVQYRADKLVCKWFKEAVLPLEPGLSFSGGDA